jgi:surfeit locus 1 family protein
MLKRSPALILVAAIGLSLLTARLGVWQLDRAHQKNERQSSIDARRALPALGHADLAHTAAQAEPQLHRPIRLSGRWAAPHTVYLDNRPMNGRPGFYVLTPLLLEDGTAVVVQRGWLARDPMDRTRVTPPPTTAASVNIEGRIAPAPARLYELGADADGAIRQNIDLDGFAAQTRLRLRPLSVQQLQPEGSEPDGLLRDWPQVAADVHKHYGYAFQWFALSALTIALYVWFQIIRPRRSRPLEHVHR